MTGLEGTDSSELISITSLSLSGLEDEIEMGELCGNGREANEQSSTPRLHLVLTLESLAFWLSVEA